jgi:signal transduction histidine kinase
VIIVKHCFFHNPRTLEKRRQLINRKQHLYPDERMKTGKRDCSFHISRYDFVVKISKHIIYGTSELLYFSILALFYQQLGESLLISGAMLIILAGWYYSFPGVLFGIILQIGGNVLILSLCGAPSDFIAVTLMPASIAMVMAFGASAAVMRRSRERLANNMASLQSEYERRTAQLERLSQILVDKDESDRIKIGQSLHDGIGQYMTGMLLHGEAVLASLKQREAHQEINLMQLNIHRIRGILQQVRRLSRTLFPLRILEIGFDVAIEEMVSYFENTHQIRFFIELNGLDKTLTPQVSLQLYRIAHEAVSNAIRHGQASRIWIRLLSAESDLKMVVENDGSPLLAHREFGMGLKLSQYRANTIFGEINLSENGAQQVALTCTLREWFL